MATMVVVPPERLDSEVLQALLEEYASRDGTDYGAEETPLAAKVADLRAQLDRGELQVLFDLDSEVWDIVLSADASAFLGG